MVISNRSGSGSVTLRSWPSETLIFKKPPFSIVPPGRTSWLMIWPASNSSLYSSVTCRLTSFSPAQSWTSVRAQPVRSTAVVPRPSSQIRKAATSPRITSTTITGTTLERVGRLLGAIGGGAKKLGFSSKRSALDGSDKPAGASAWGGCAGSFWLSSFFL